MLAYKVYVSYSSNIGKVGVEEMDYMPDTYLVGSTEEVLVFSCLEVRGCGEYTLVKTFRSDMAAVEGQ